MLINISIYPRTLSQTIQETRPPSLNLKDLVADVPMDADEPGVVVKLLEVGTIGPREMFGEISLVLSTTRAASVVSTTPVELFVLNKNDFVRKITGKTFDVIRENLHLYKSERVIREQYFEAIKWEHYKQSLVKDVLANRDAREKARKLNAYF